MSSLYKAQRLLADIMYNNNNAKRTSSRQLDQQHRRDTPAVDAAGSAVYPPDQRGHDSQHQRQHHHPHVHHHEKKLHHHHHQHSLGDIVREPLRQQQQQQPTGQQRHHSLTQQQQHRLAAYSKSKRSDAASASASSRHGSSTLESVTDNGAGEAAEESLASSSSSNRSRPCLDRGARLPAGMTDVDQCGHCTMVSAYAKDIFVYLAERELHYALPRDFLAGQAEVTERSRAVLVDWLLQLAGRLELQIDTYHLGVRLLDHYLAVDRSLGKHQLQLLGATALWLASKFEEVYSIGTADLLHFCSGVCTRRDLLAMELRLVGALDFQLLPPLPITFLRRLSKVAGVDNQLHYAAKYLLELATLCARLAWRPASQLAAAAMRLALGSGGRDWTTMLAFYSGYTLAELRPAVADLALACLRAASAAAAPAVDASAAGGGNGCSGRHYRYVFQKYQTAACFAVSGCPQLGPGSAYLAGLIADR